MVWIGPGPGRTFSPDKIHDFLSWDPAAMDRAQGGTTGFRLDADTAAGVIETLGQTPNRLDRPDWVRLALALKSELGDGGRTAFLEFSGRWEGGVADPDEDARVWDTARPNGSVTTGTAVHLLQLSATHAAPGQPVGTISVQPGSEVPQLPAPAAPGPQRLFVPTPFILRDPAEIPPREWLYGSHLIRGFVSVTVSPGGLGKSSLVNAEAVVMATGKPLLGEHTYLRCRVWSWNGEDPADEIARRFNAICRHYGVTEEDLGGRLFTDSGRGMPIRLVEEGNRGTPIIARPVVEDLVAALIERQIDVLVVDPFVMTHGVDENANTAINQVIALWREVADRAGCAVELVHHATKLARLQPDDLGIAQARGAVP